jgi:hypothetical protein
MSWRGIGQEAKEHLHEHRSFFFLIVVGLGIFLLGGLYFLNKNMNQKSIIQAEESSNESFENVLAQLIQIRAEADQVRRSLAERERHSQVSLSAQNVRMPSVVSGKTFISVKPGSGFQNIQTGSEKIYIPAGSLFRANLLMPIKTSIQENFVMAETAIEFRMDSFRRIDRGTRLIGSARLDPILRGVVVRFNRLVTPRGQEFPVQILALSHELFPQLEGIYFSNQLETYSSILAFGFLGGFADSARKREPSIFGQVPTPDLTNNLLTGASTASFRVMEEMIRDIQKRAVEYVVVPAGEPVFLVFEQQFEIPQGGSLSGVSR